MKIKDLKISITWELMKTQRRLDSKHKKKFLKWAETESRFATEHLDTLSRVKKKAMMTLPNFMFLPDVFVMYTHSHPFL